MWVFSPSYFIVPHNIWWNGPCCSKMWFHELLCLRAHILLWQPRSLSYFLLSLTVLYVLQEMTLCTGQTWAWIEYPGPNVIRPGEKILSLLASVGWKASLLTGLLVSSATPQALELSAVSCQTCIDWSKFLLDLMWIAKKTLILSDRVGYLTVCVVEHG